MTGTLGILALALTTATGWRPPEDSTTGMLVDVGLPEGMGVSFAYRPATSFRVQAGLGTNGVGLGIRGGFSFILLPGVFRPTLSLSAGHFGDGDARPLMKTFAPNTKLKTEILSQIGYDYVAAQTGFEAGDPNGMSFFLRAGVSRSFVRLPTLADGGTPPRLILTSPSAQLGMLLYFR